MTIDYNFITLTKINKEFNRGGGSMVVRINNNLWKIQFTYPQNPNLRMSDGRQVLGLCDNNIKTIFIADNQSDYKTEHILCHEITHAICFEYDIHLDYEMEEWFSLSSTKGLLELSAQLRPTLIHILHFCLKVANTISPKVSSTT